MTEYEYRVVPSPARGEKAPGIKGPEARFAHALERLMNEMAAEGWEYQRAETLPSEERAGLTGSVTHWRNLLVFRRPRAGDVAALQPRLLDAPGPTDRNGTEAPDLPRSAGLGAAGLRLTQPKAPPLAPGDSPPAAQPGPVPTPGKTTGAPGNDTQEQRTTPEDAEDDVIRWSSVQGFARPPAQADNGVEETNEMSGLTSALRARAARLMFPARKHGDDTA